MDGWTDRQTQLSEDRGAVSDRGESVHPQNKLFFLLPIAHPCFQTAV